MGEWRSKSRRPRRNPKFTIAWACFALLIAAGIGVILMPQNKPTVNPSVNTTQEINVEDVNNASDESFYEKLQSSSVIRVLVIGDSIGADAGVKSKTEGWTTLLKTALKEKYGSNVFFENLSVGGSTVFGGYSDYLKKKKILKSEYDAVFICFGQNDQSAITLEQYGEIYERLVRTVKTDRNNPEIFGIIESSIKEDKFPNKLIELSKQYDFPVIDTREAFTNSGMEYSELTDDGVHPNALGYVLYKDQVLKVISNNLTSKRVVVEWKEDVIPYLYNSESYISLINHNRLNTDGGFTLNNAYISGKVGSFIETTFTGQVLGLSVRKDQASGIVDVYVDGEKIQSYDAYSPTPYNFIYLVSDNLTEGDHTLRLEISKDKNVNSTGNEFKLYEIYSK